MADSRPNYEVASAEDYFSDNTEGRNQIALLKRSGANMEPVKARCIRPSHAKRTSSFGQRIIRHAIRKLSEAEFNARLDKVNIPRPTDPVDMLPVLRDGVFSYISDLLRQFGQGEWALRPRTFCILRILGCPEAMDTFIKLKKTDAFLPYNDRNLPDAIKGAELRERFLKLQGLVLSNLHLKELEEEGSAHFHFRALADECFSPIRTLGRGGAGMVDEVYGKFTLKYFARKRIHRGMSALKDQESLDSFQKELRALKAATHRHLVKLVSSYSDPMYVGLIMRPVADQDLKAYLLQSWSSKVDSNAQKQCLRTFFGCLIKALEYLHHHGIIHKDIKPQNILVKKEEIYFTDFGTSKTLGEASRSFSTGMTGKITERYCAPEVMDQAPRGRPSDLWSMGCVFLEMATILLGRSLNDLEAYYASHGTESRYFYKNEEATGGWIEELKSQSESQDRRVLDWTKSMLKQSQTDRPTASQVVAKISDTPSDHRYFCFNCLDDAPYDTGHQQSHTSNSDMANEATLQSYLRRDSVHDTDSEDVTVTSKILEEKGVVSVASDVESLDDAAQVQAAELDQDELEISPPTSAIPTEDPEASPSNLATAEQTSDEQTRREVAEDTPKHLPAALSQPLRSSMKPPGAQSTHKEVRFDQKQPTDEELPRSSGRFSVLTSDRRPLPSKPAEGTVDLDEMPIVAPEPLKPPPMDPRACYPLPKATLVPSYILAGTNRFSMKEVRASSEITMDSRNLFVYGRLMFPSVLRAFAAHSILGVYSPMHQRRLVPTSKDWAFVDMSVKRAAEAMTPARLKDFDVWRPSRMQLAAIQDSSRTNRILINRAQRGLPPLEKAPPAEVVGFLILGVTEEVLRYCDLIFTSDIETLKRAQVRTKGGNRLPVQDGFFERKLVTVDVQLTAGDSRSVLASTYVWSQEGNHLRHPWRPEEFIRGHSFQDICHIHAIDWRREEMALAETMKIGYALVGDELCSAILADDLSRLQDLLDNYDDVDARCRKYGTPLQAAVAVGNHEAVRLLLEHHANPSASGGKYGTPLIAATVGKRRAITRLLLKHRADIFASHPQYVNALYQAVGSSDWALTEMILEAGGWLSKDYEEIRDLAIEKRDRDLQDLLLEYDVRDTNHLRLQERGNDSQVERRHGEYIGFLRKYGPVTKAVLKKFFVVSGQSGSMRGRKGVAITRAALAAGAPPVILDHIRNAIDPVMKLIDMLKAADKQQELARKAEIENMGRVEELGSEGGDDGDDDGEKSPILRVSESEDQESRTTRYRAPSPLSLQSSTSSVNSWRSHGSRDSQLGDKRGRFQGAALVSSPAVDLPPQQPGGSSPKPTSPSRPSYKPADSRACPGVPQIVTPTFTSEPPRRNSPSGEMFSPVSSRQASLEISPRSPQYLYPPSPGRPRAHSLEENRYTPVPQVHTHSSLPTRLHPTSPVSTRRWNPELNPGSRHPPERPDEYYNRSRPRSSSDTTNQRRCAKCNGLGYYRERLRGQTGLDIIREVSCGCCEQ